MKEKTRSVVLAGISAAIGGSLGAVSGSSSWIVVAIVSAVFGVLAAWGLNSVVK